MISNADIEGAALLRDLAAFVRRFVVLSAPQAIIVSVWIIHTHAIEAFDSTPFLMVTSVERRSGKTRLFEVIEMLVREPLRAIVPSAAVIFRLIEQKTPTLLLDEVNTVFGAKAGEAAEALRGILNAGNRRGVAVPRCVGLKHEAVLFPVFCPKALAGIGRLPDTVADRSIPIRLKRRAPGEHVERFRTREIGAEATSLRERAAAWAVAHIESLRTSRPAFPAGLNDRAEDGAEPLLAIADLAGGDWPDKVRRGLVELCAGQEVVEDSTGGKLLSDIRALYEETGEDRTSSAALCEALATIEEAPWGEWYGKAITPRTVARLLRPYGIEPRNLKTEGGRVVKGYRRDQFEDAWTRYLPPSSPSQGEIVRYSATVPEKTSQDPVPASATGGEGSGPTKRVVPNVDGPGSEVAENPPSVEAAKAWAPLSTVLPGLDYRSRPGACQEHGVLACVSCGHRTAGTK